MSGAKRMAASQRRRQLLEVALKLIACEGTDHLTLSRVAEAAGVTKPVAYCHFGDRAGLLKALYLDYDNRQRAAMNAAIEAKGGSLEKVAEVMSAAHMECALSGGPEMAAIAAALSATDDMEAFREGLRKECLEDLRRAFAPYAPGAGLPDFVGIQGASDALAKAAVVGRMSRRDAERALAGIMVGALAGAAGGKPAA